MLDGIGVTESKAGGARASLDPNQGPPSHTSQAAARTSTPEPAMKAVSAEEGIAMIPHGATVMVGGFMGVGTPERLLDELVRQKKGQLNIIANDAAGPGQGIGKWLDGS